VKSAPAGFLSAKKMPMRKHEMVYCFYEKLPFYDLSSHKHKFIKANIKNEPTNKKEDDLYGIESGNAGRKKGFHQTSYDPPLPVSVVKEPEPEPEAEINKVERKSTYGNIKTHDIKTGKNNAVPRYDPPLPVSVVKEDVYNSKERFKNGKLTKHPRHLQKGDDPIYDPPLPTTMLEIKSTRGKHSTEKPVALMEWLLKYFSKEGDTVLDPTMGSGSTGVACKNMNRNFIGIEKDPEIYEVAVNRIEN